MNKLRSSKIKAVLEILLYGIIGLLIHKLCFYFLVDPSLEASFAYSIPILYLFFLCFSVLIVLALDKVKKINIDYVGYTFLLLTSFKIGIAFIFAKPILSANLPKTPIEKLSFFIIFIYFLTIETYLTIRILNNKQ